jgi:hypothetical protein
MSDDLDEEQNEDPTPKQLRDAAKRGKEAEARAEAAERALAFAKAGLDLTDPRVEKYFLPAYDGELDPSKIKEAAQRDGFLTPPEEPPAVTTEEQNAIQRMSRATEGAEAPSQTDYNADLSELPTPRCGNIGIRTGSRWKSRSSSTGWAAKCLSTVNRSFLRSIEVTAHLKGVSSLG